MPILNFITPLFAAAAIVAFEEDRAMITAQSRAIDADPGAPMMLLALITILFIREVPLRDSAATPVALGIAHHTLTDEATMPFIVDRSIKQAVTTQAPVALILSPLLTGGKVFDK